jgi:hypothetical protein
MTKPPPASPLAAIKQEPLQGKLEPSFWANSGGDSDRVLTDQSQGSIFLIAFFSQTDIRPRITGQHRSQTLLSRRIHGRAIGTDGESVLPPSFLGQLRSGAAFAESPFDPA